MLVVVHAQEWSWSLFCACTCTCADRSLSLLLQCFYMCGSRSWSLFPCKSADPDLCLHSLYMHRGRFWSSFGCSHVCTYRKDLIFFNIFFLGGGDVGWGEVDHDLYSSALYMYVYTTTVIQECRSWAFSFPSWSDRTYTGTDSDLHSHAWTCRKEGLGVGKWAGGC